MSGPDGADDPHEAIRRIFAAFADDPAPAYRTDTETLDFATLHRGALVLLREMRVLPGAEERRPVLVLGHKDIRYPVAYWACLLGGFPLVPVEPDTPDLRVAQIAKASEAFAAVSADGREEAEEKARGVLADHGVPVIGVDTGKKGTPRDEAAATRVAPSDTAYIMFSSGTLGQPKGIRVTYANLVDFIRWLDELLPPSEPLRAVSGNIRYCFDVSLFEIWTSWCRKVPLVALDHADFADSSRYIRRLSDDQAGVWISTPSITRLFLKNPRFVADRLPSLRTFVFCGEPLTKPIVAELMRRFPGCRVVNTYGPTECTVAVTSAEITAREIDAFEDLPIGLARPGTEVFTPDGGEEGEIIIRGISVGAGYIGFPEKQARAFPEPGLYRTGDLGRRRPDGNWYFRGRLDREVKIQGMRIDLNEVEEHIRKQYGVEDVIVDPFVLRGEPRALNAYVIGAGDAGFLQGLASSLAAELPAYMVPRFWYAGFDEALNANSKLDRSRLAEAGRGARHRLVHGGSPRLSKATN